MSIIGQTVAEWISDCNMGRGTTEWDYQIQNYRELKIAAQYGIDDAHFPQSGFAYRNVMNWVMLEDGSAVGWNESPRNGWSFPRIGKRTVDKNFKR